LEDWVQRKEGSAPAAITIDDDDDVHIQEESSEEGVNLHDIPTVSDEEQNGQGGRASKAVPAANDDKKLAPHTIYDGFSIYGRVLCLVVKRKGIATSATGSKAISSQQMIENWVSTQVASAAKDEDFEREAADVAG
jgi:hypothetical protein